VNQDRAAGTGPAGVAIIEFWTFETDPTLIDVDLTGYSVEATDG
jgi:hypothetical protein